MQLRKLRNSIRFAAFACSWPLLGTGIAMAQQNGGSAEVEVLTRGPVHEAFAGTVTFNPEAGIIVKTQPPAVIEEMPPEERPEGDNVSWIPGYWAWDEESDDFLWISGIWRNLPPGRQWVPGYWSDADGQYQWTSGYWEDAETTEVSYLPEPPRSVEAGPNIEAPSKDHNWVSGNWIWRENRYAWRSGYWAPVRENWIWTPAYYRWTHRGYVYVDGYWDYSVAHRGVLFAPVHFEHSVYTRPNYYYSPVTVIALAVFADHLFLRPSYSHYYFGDYYAPRYRSSGFYASYSYNSGHRGWDPIYSHNRWEHRDDRNWENNRRDYYEYRRDHEDARPPRTWAAMNALPEGRRGRGSDFEMAQPLDRYAKNGGSGHQRFQAVAKQDRERIVSQRQEVRNYSRDRQQLETSGGKVPSSNRTEASRMKVGRSPLVAKQSSRKDEAPPKRLQSSTAEIRQQSAKSDKQETAKQPGRDPGPNGKNNDGGNRKGDTAENRKDDQGVNPKGDKPNQRGEDQKNNPKGDKPDNRKDGPGTDPKGDKPNNQKDGMETNPKGDKPDNRKDTPNVTPRKEQVQPERKPEPAPKHKADPSPDKPKANPAPKRRDNPQPQANPSPKKAEPRRANPDQGPRVEKKSARQSPQQQPSKKAAPEKRRDQPQTQKRQSNNPGTATDPNKESGKKKRKEE